MIINCPECELQVSDKAIACPHCGYPIDKEATVRIKRKKNGRHRRLPNGFGSITKITGKYLRKPYLARVTVGKNEYGIPIVRTLKPESYFETYNDAYNALMEYNKNPYDLEDSSMTMLELYNKWSPTYFESLESESSRRTIRSAWNYCSSIYNMRVVDIRARHIKGCMENGTYTHRGETRTPSANIKSRIKSLFNLMLDYALEYELVTTNYARTFDISSEVINEQEKMKNEHIPFTQDEINTLWSNIYKVDYVDVLLFQCYSGWRPQEIGLLKVKDVDFEQHIIVGGMKTKAGKQRIVPIHPLVLDIVQRLYNQALELNSEYLINCVDTETHRNNIKMTYDKYRYRIDKIVTALKLNPNHRAHDGRKHFVTLAKRYKLDEYAIKYIVGHNINDITEKVYTKRDPKWLYEEMQKIK